MIFEIGYHVVRAMCQSQQCGKFDTDPCIGHESVRRERSEKIETDAKRSVRFAAKRSGGLNNIITQMNAKFS
jgi:hypothetical protein